MAESQTNLTPSAKKSQAEFFFRQLHGNAKQGTQLLFCLA